MKRQPSRSQRPFRFHMLNGQRLRLALRDHRGGWLAGYAPPRDMVRELVNLGAFSPEIETEWRGR